MIRLLTRPSLFRRLLIVELLAAGGFWIAYAGLTMYSIYDQGEGFLDQDLQLVAQGMVRVASTHSDLTRMRGVVEHIVALNYETTSPPLPQGDFAYQIWRSDGSLLFRSDSPGLEPVAPGSIPLGHRSQRGGWIVHGAYSPDRTLFAVAAYSDRTVSRLRLQLIGDASLGYLWVMAVLTIILWIAAMIGLRPLRSLAAQLAARDRADLTALRPAVAYGELMPLTSALNDKMEYIRALLDRERAFFADAAHELRTPLAALEAQAHVLAVQSNSVERTRALRAFEQGIERAADILNKLLLLARLDGRLAAPVRQHADVPSILRRQVAQYAPRVIAVDSQIELQVPEAADLLCDPSAIETAVDCLIDNAVAHTPGGTTIVVRLTLQPGTCVIDVSDDGPGIPQPERERVFDRFVRLDSAIGAGSGLGLSIVRNVARMHGGDVSVHTGERGRGCRFEIRIPTAQPRA